MLACLGVLVAAATLLSPVVTRPGYSIRLVSGGVPASSVAQLAFQPGDPGHLYAVQATGNVLRYDYHPLTGDLSNPVIVRSGMAQALGLAFHGNDAYVTIDRGGSSSSRPGDGRIARLSAPNASGVYQVRHDFVHSIDKGDHDVNQLVIVGNTLYTGIGAVTRNGDPSRENVYTMTIARIADLTAIDWSGPIGSDFKGPVNYLASPAEWTNTAPADGYLRYYASGFRNPFGLAADEAGGLWVSTNGNSDPGFLSHDELYKEVPPGGQGTFPPASFGFPPPLILGTPIAPLTDLGQNPSPTGLDFVPGGVDQGFVVLAQAGATDQVNFPVGKDVLRVDPLTGAFETLVDAMNLPTDVQRDPFGRLLISDYADGSIWLLTPPRARVGDVANLRLGKSGGNVALTWSPSCSAGDLDYEVYEGALSDFAAAVPRACSTGSAAAATLAPGAGNRFYLVVPRDAWSEGSHGRRSGGAERPQPPAACRPQVTGACTS